MPYRVEVTSIQSVLLIAVHALTVKEQLCRVMVGWTVGKPALVCPRHKKTWKQQVEAFIKGFQTSMRPVESS